MQSMSIADHLKAYEQAKHNIELPVFDVVSYNKILSRIGRQQNLLPQKKLGSEAYNRLYDSLNRSRKLKKSYVNKYLTDLAIYVAFYDLECGLPTFMASDIVPNTPFMKNFMTEHWDSFMDKYNKAKKLY